MEKFLEVLASQRIVPLTGEVNEGEVDKIREQLALLNTKSNEKIHLLIDSKGGYTKPALWLYDFLQLLTAPVIGLVNGQCESSALLILQGCTKRLATENSTFQFHYLRARISIHYDPNGNYKAFLNSRIQEDQEILRQSLEILTKRIGKSEKELMELAKRGEQYDEHFSAQKAKELGFIDEVLSEKYKLF